MCAHKATPSQTRGSRWGWVAALLVGVALGALAVTFFRPWAGQKEGDPVAKTQARKVYVVQQVYWHYVDRSWPFTESEPPGAGFPRKVFSDRGAADVYARRLDRAARKDRNPFEHGRGLGKSFPSLDAFTSMPTDLFIDWLAAEGLNPPADQKQVWQEAQHQKRRTFDQVSHNAWWSWWYEQSPTWTAAQQEAVWEKLDRVRFYEVVEVAADL